jgi:hypothetical protein
LLVHLAVKLTSEDGRALHADTDQLRLAFLELGRISREIDALEARPDVSAHHPLLMSLQACRAALLRMADARMHGRSRHSLELSFDETQLS